MARLGNLGGSRAGELSDELTNASGVARGYGLDPAAGVGLFGQLHGLRLTNSGEDIGIPHDLSAVMSVVQSAQYTSDVCGRCANYDPAKRGCREINMLVNPKNPGCAAFISQE